MREAKAKLEDALAEVQAEKGQEPAVREMEKRVWSEVDCENWKTQTTQLIRLFSLAWQEQQRTDAILNSCLPQIKEHFLLLSSYDQKPERQLQFRVSRN